MAKTWARIEFKFKSNKNAYRFQRWLSMGKELGLIPDSLEIQYSLGKVILGHWAPGEGK